MGHLISSRDKAFPHGILEPENPQYPMQLDHFLYLIIIILFIFKSLWQYVPAANLPGNGGSIS